MNESDFTVGRRFLISTGGNFWICFIVLERAGEFVHYRSEAAPGDYGMWNKAKDLVAEGAQGVGEYR